MVMWLRLNGDRPAHGARAQGVAPDRVPCVYLGSVLRDRLTRVRRGVAAGCLLLASLSAAQACPLALVMALDVSSSVDAREYRLQMGGIRSAFRDPDVIETIVANGGMMVTVYEWSGRNQQVAIADWTWLADASAILAFADRLGNAPRRFSRFPTALGYALGHAAIQFDGLPRQCARKVVDVSGDGVNNEGFPPESAYRAFDFSQITVNGLVIAGAEPDPVAYYSERVIRGSGAFVEVARDFSDYADAMKRKLIREIRGNAFAHLDRPTHVR